MAGSAFGVIFDCDGTLVDSMGAWRELEADLARRVGAELDKEDTDALTTMSIPECGAYLHGKFGLGESPEEVVGMIDGFMMDYYANRSVARPGALRFVRGLADAGVPMAVASSTPSALLHAGIEHAGFAPYMRAIVSVDDVGKSKREPAVYDRAREALGTTRAQTWGFEDATYALRTLNAAGYHTFGVYDCDLSGTLEELAGEADMVARSFEDVSAWCTSRSRRRGRSALQAVLAPQAPHACEKTPSFALKTRTTTATIRIPIAVKRLRCSRRAPGISGRSCGRFGGRACAPRIARARAEARRHPASPFRLDVSFPREFVIKY